MIEPTMLIFFGSLALTLILNVTGVALGQARIGQATIKASDTQPQIQQTLSKTSIIAMAISETACILSLTFIIILLFRTNIKAPHFQFMAIAQSSIIFALGIAGCLVSFYSSFPAVHAIYAIAQQPFFASKILNVMLVSLSIIQSPIIFGFLIMLLINAQIESVTSINNALRLFSAGLCIGCGSIGPIIGQGLFAKSACTAVGINRNVYNRVLSFALLSQTLIETPIILALVVSLLLIFSPIPSDLRTIAFVMAAICQSIATLAPGISSGRIASTACKQITVPGANSTTLQLTSLLAQGLIDSSAIFGLLVSILLIYGTA